MKQVEQFKWFLPNPNPRGRPYLSRFHMTREEAAARGATQFEPGSRIVITMAETPDEERELRRASDTGAVQRR